MWHRIVALMIKELLALLRDKRSRFVVIGPPLFQLLIFGYAATFDLNHVPYAVYTESSGAAARDLLARFAGSPHFRLVATLHRQEDIRTLIENQQALLVVHIGPAFSRDIALGQPAPLQLIVDGRNSNTASLAQNYARQIVTRFNLDWLQSHGLSGPPAVIESRAWFNPNLLSRWFFVPGLVGLITLVVTMMVTSMSVAREREQGTFDQLLVTPLTPLDVIIGKSLPGLIIGLFEAGVIVLIAVFWFGVPLLGSVFTMLGGTLLFLLSAIGMGLMISALSATLQQALLGTFLFLMPAVILSGFATPIANMPQPVQWLTLADPLRYFLIIIRGVFLQGASFEVLADQFWPMAVIGVVTLSIASWLFRHRLN